MTKTTATIVGFLTAPLIASITSIVLNPVAGKINILSMLTWLPIFYFFSALATIMFGVPTFFLLRHFRLINWWSSLGAGAVIGGLFGIVLRLPSPVQVHDITAMAPIGAASAFGFWLILRQGR